MEIKIKIVGDDAEYQASLIKLLFDAVHAYGHVSTEKLVSVGAVKTFEASLDRRDDICGPVVHVVNLDQDQIDRFIQATENNIARGVRPNGQRFKL